MKISRYLTTLLFPFLLGISTYKQLNSQEIVASAYFGIERENSAEILSPGNIQNGYFTRFDKGGLEAIVVPNITTEPDNVEFSVSAPPGLEIRADSTRIWSVGPIGNEHIEISYIMRDMTTGASTHIDLSGEADSLIWEFLIEVDLENYPGFFSDRFGTDVVAPIFGGISDSVSVNKQDNPYETFALLDSIAAIEERNPIEAKEGIGERNVNGQELRELFPYYAHGGDGENEFFKITIETSPIGRLVNKDYRNVAASEIQDSKNISLSDLRLEQFFPDTVHYAEKNNPGYSIEDGSGGDGMSFPVEVVCPYDTLYESHTTPTNFSFTLDKIEHEPGDSLWTLWYLSETNDMAPLERITFWFSPEPVSVQGEEDSYSSGTIPKEITLSQNYPNPFNPITRISYSIPQGYDKANVSLNIYDARGRLVRTLENTIKEEGNYSVTWDGLNEYGMPSVSGPYLCDLKVNNERRTRKMNLVK